MTELPRVELPSLLAQTDQVVRMGGARLAGTDNMIAALERLKRIQEEPLPAQFEAFGIATGKASTGIARLFMSHPPLDERIAALRTTPLA